MTTVRARALANATRNLGVHEDPPNTNHGPKIDAWGKACIGVPGGFPWCASFMWNMFKLAGYTVDAKHRALVQSWVEWAREKGFVVRRPFRGDVVCYDWNEDGTRDHIGIVERVLALRWRGRVFVGWVQAIEGNTSARDDSNGGEVQRRRRWVNRSTVFIRIPDPD